MESGACGRIVQRNKNGTDQETACVPSPGTQHLLGDTAGHHEHMEVSSQPWPLCSRALWQMASLCGRRRDHRMRSTSSRTYSGPARRGEDIHAHTACERRRRLRQCHNATRFDPNVRAGMPTTEGSIEKAPSPLMLDVCVLDRKSPTCSRLHGLHGMASEKGPVLRVISVLEGMPPVCT